MDWAGLKLPWHGKVFLNPPYGRSIHEWTSKAKAEVAAGNADLVVAILPVRSDTTWWHEDIADCATVFFLRGRLSFGEGGQSAPFPSALVLWGGTPEHIAALKAAPSGVATRLATAAASAPGKKASFR